MKKLTNMIGSYVIAIIIMVFPIIVGIGMAGDWLEKTVEGVLIHPWLAILWTLCVFCTILEVGALGFMISIWDS